ncbi:Iron siderophore sensor protein [plant metagenome]|uniref:Iron siderophore sensor protein n=1 Tax=plant metagenome TaxID=1297885 RepID=A0A484TDP9_9ZZZZ
MTAASETSTDALRDHAARWFARVHSGEATHAEIDACAAWRRSDPAHEAAYQRVSFLWEASRHLPEDKLRALAAPPAAQPAVRAPGRRRFALATAGLCAAGTAGVVAWPWLRSGALQYEASLDTMDGTRQEIPLPDGSLLNLNANTRLRVTFREKRRHVALETGQAFFTIRADKARPFVVQAGDATITVTGTRFDVWHDALGTRIAVASGTVRVWTASWWHGIDQDLGADQAIDVAPDGRSTPVLPVQAENLAAWRLGKVIFDDTPLPLAVQEINRYLPQGVTLRAPLLHDYRVAAVFSIDDPQSMLSALPAIAPVRLQRQSDGSTVVLPR